MTAIRDDGRAAALAGDAHLPALHLRVGERILGGALRTGDVHRIAEELEVSRVPGGLIRGQRAREDVSLLQLAPAR